ncbi:MAG: tRNA uridine-5-carboxymethylaminomethyl(34) synthesis GTPase MnmE, partial [Spirochaetia bacterium]|nr:tRNA uridine-5-carboxymethylaminomethyl(34) synthesis GTPase MnmE [Spirochaetia bacterium]
MNNTDTILQLSTPYAVSAVHIIRVSGKEAHAFVKKAIGLEIIEPRKIYYRPFAVQGRTIDQVISFFFTTPNSYTGEDMAEIQCHGSLIIVDAILKAGLASGLRLAERGEFTRRAFLNGKMSLEQTEAVDTLIRSRSEFFRDNALRILENKSSLRFDTVKKDILD